MPPGVYWLEDKVLARALGQLGEEALHLIDVIARRFGLARMLEAVHEAAGDEAEPDVLKRLGRRAELRHDLSAVSPFRQHRFDSLDLAGRSTEPNPQILGDLFGEFHDRPLSVPQRVPGEYELLTNGIVGWRQYLHGLSSGTGSSRCATGIPLVPSAVALRFHPISRTCSSRGPLDVTRSNWVRPTMLVIATELGRR